jgi:chemotaxis protein histidine kinase CheA
MGIDRTTTAGNLFGVARTQQTVQIPNVRAVSRGLSLVCEIRGRRFAVPFNEIEEASRVQKPGDYGTLIIRTEAARRIGLSI